MGPLGARDRGHLAPGAVADVAIYRDKADRAAMFRDAELVLKDGVSIVRNGEPLAIRYGRTLALSPEHDPAITRYVRDAYDKRWGAPPDTFTVPERLLQETSPFEHVACQTGGRS